MKDLTIKKLSQRADLGLIQSLTLWPSQIRFKMLRNNSI